MKRVDIDNICVVAQMLYRGIFLLFGLLGQALQGVVDGDTTLFFVGSQNAVS